MLSQGELDIDQLFSGIFTPVKQNDPAQQQAPSPAARKTLGIPQRTIDNPFAEPFQVGIGSNILKPDTPEIPDAKEPSKPPAPPAQLFGDLLDDLPQLELSKDKKDQPERSPYKKTMALYSDAPGMDKVVEAAREIRKNSPTGQMEAHWRKPDSAMEPSGLEFDSSTSSVHPATTMSLSELQNPQELKTDVPAATHEDPTAMMPTPAPMAAANAPDALPIENNYLKQLEAIQEDQPNSGLEMAGPQRMEMERPLETGRKSTGMAAFGANAAIKETTNPALDLDRNRPVPWEHSQQKPQVSIPKVPQQAKSGLVSRSLPWVFTVALLCGSLVLLFAGNLVGLKGSTNIGRSDFSLTPGAYNIQGFQIYDSPDGKKIGVLTGTAGVKKGQDISALNIRVSITDYTGAAAMSAEFPPATILGPSQISDLRTQDEAMRRLSEKRVTSAGAGWVPFQAIFFDPPVQMERYSFKVEVPGAGQ
ncbi:MAG: hypothetical protein WC889_06645 [Myxococcota bacterium]|jgi:hypothetical protein